MVNTYFNLNFKNIIASLFLLFCVGVSQNIYALMPSFGEKSTTEKSQLKSSKQKINQQQQLESTKKTIFESKNVKSRTKRKKISFRKKLSILKLVLKMKSSDKHSYKAKQKKSFKKWNGQHTAGLLSWASVLVAAIAFFAGHFLLGILAVCSAILFFLLIFVEKGNTGTVDDVLWLFAQIINIIVIIGSIFD